MKAIQFCLPSGEIASNAAIIWLAFKFFPDDEASRRQVIMIGMDEKERFEHVNGIGWKPSELTEQISAWRGKRNGQLLVAGYTALAFVLLLEKGVSNPTLYAASKVVADAISQIRQGNELPFKMAFFEGDWHVRGTTAPTGRKDIADAFKTHRSVVHLAAADIAVSEHIQLMHVFNRTSETMGSAIVTGHAIETVLAEKVSKEFFDFWTLRENSAQISEYAEPIYIEGDTRDFLALGMP